MTHELVNQMIEQSEDMNIEVIESDWTFKQSSCPRGMLLVLDRNKQVTFSGTELEFVVKYGLPECVIMFKAAETIAVTHFPAVDKTLVVNECFRTLVDQWQMPDWMSLQRPGRGIFFLFLIMTGRLGTKYANNRYEGDAFWHDRLVDFLFQWLTGNVVVPYISAHEQRHRRYDEERDSQVGTQCVVLPKCVKSVIVPPLEIDVAPFDNRKFFAIWELELMPESKIVELIKSRLGPPPAMEDDEQVWDSWDSEAWQTDKVCGDDVGLRVEMERCISIDHIQQHTKTRPRGKVLYVSQQLKIAKTWADTQTVSIKRQRTITRQWHDAMRHIISLTKGPLFTHSNHLCHREMHREQHVKLLLECARSGIQILNLFQLSLLP